MTRIFRSPDVGSLIAVQNNGLGTTEPGVLPTKFDVGLTRVRTGYTDVDYSHMAGYVELVPKESSAGNKTDNPSASEPVAPKFKVHKSSGARGEGVGVEQQGMIVAGDDRAFVAYDSSPERLNALERYAENLLQAVRLVREYKKDPDKAVRERVKKALKQSGYGHTADIMDDKALGRIVEAVRDV